MHTETHLGRNRTGIQMSPFETTDAERSQRDYGPMPDEEAREDLAVRRDYADANANDGGFGSVPVPATMKGVMASGVDMMTGKRPQTLVDKLGERLAFERGGVRLYDSLLVKCAASPSAIDATELEMLRHFRDEEAQHMTLVKQAIEQLGCDPTAQTPCADLVGVQSMGMVQAMNDPRSSVLQALHVMLDAELIDNAAWEMLIELGQATGHDKLVGSFDTAARQEAVHLEHLRQLVGRLTLEDAGRERAAESAASAPSAVVSDVRADRGGDALPI